MLVTKKMLAGHVRKAITHVENTTKEPWHKHEWQKEQSANYIAENTNFLDRFESAPGESIEDIRKSSENKRCKGTLGRLAGAAVGLALCAGSACMAGPLAVGTLLVGTVMCVGGGIGAFFTNDKERAFQGKINVLENEVKHGEAPSLSSGRYDNSNSSSDDEFMNFGVNLQGQYGWNLGGGLQLGINGKAHSSF